MSEPGKVDRRGEVERVVEHLNDLAEYAKENPNGTCWSTTHYFRAEVIGRVLAEIRTRMILGADTETDCFVLEFLSDSVFHSC